jgi:hypothetical protein
VPRTKTSEGHGGHGLIIPFSNAGFNEPNALAIIANDGSGDNHVFHLYVREKDPKAELWDGARSGTRAAVDVFNADEVRTFLLMKTF